MKDVPKLEEILHIDVIEPSGGSRLTCYARGVIEGVALISEINCKHTFIEIGDVLYSEKSLVRLNGELYCIVDSMCEMVQGGSYECRYILEAAKPAPCSVELGTKKVKEIIKIMEEAISDDPERMLAGIGKRSAKWIIQLRTDKRGLPEIAKLQMQGTTIAVGGVIFVIVDILPRCILGGLYKCELTLMQRFS